MLFLVFKLGRDRYALEAACIVEVLPLVDMKHLPHSELGVAGIFDYRGSPLPVIDLSMLTLGRAAKSRLSTRIVIANHVDAAGKVHRLGLIAEGATETIRRERDDFAELGISSAAAPYLGPVIKDSRGLIERIDVNGLLSEPIRELFFDPIAAG